MKLNEFKKAKLNELDLSSFLGDYGSAAVRSGLGSLGGKNVLSSTDQMAKDDFIKKFNSRALSGLQSAIGSGLVDPAASGKTSGANIGTNFGNNPAKKPVTNPVTNPTTQVNPKAGKNVSPTPAQNRGAANTAGANAVTILVAVNGIKSDAAATTAASFGQMTVASGVTGQGRFTLMFSSATAYTFTRTA